MTIVTLPDGSTRSFDHPVTVFAVAQSIGEGLAKAALAGKVNGQLVDTSFVIEDNVSLSLITGRDPEALEVIRHSTAHLLAQAAKRLFPSIQVTIGPVIEEGFYYDFAFPERTFTPADLELIEKEMKAIVKEALPITRSVLSRDEAIAFFKAQGELYKVQIIEAIPSNETLTLYTQGEFTDLCRGPHVPNTKYLAVFKLMKLAGAYWRGDATQAVLQRVYGTAWADKKELDAYLYRLEEAEKRDHRKLAKTLDLYHIQEDAPGMIFWHPNGWAIYLAVEHYIRSRLREAGYQEIKTPQIADRTLWERSGHAANYAEHMFKTESENHEFFVKPMSCPCHIQVFNQGLKSYRDLPIRLAEFGCCHRNEFSGTLHGLMRVRAFTQDDAHIFCTEEQVQEEARGFITLLNSVYRDFGFTDVFVRLSLRPEKRVGTDALWDKAEAALEMAIRQAGLSFQAVKNEGAFYGPKIDFSLKDCLGRTWQLGTLQLDYSLPERLGAEYVAEDGSKRVPVMLHRAILGSLERFIGVLTEHHAGIFPLWLSPIQAVVMNITDNQSDYVAFITQKLKSCGFRVTSDLRNEKINYKIREHTVKKVPYLLVVGDKEKESKCVSVRRRDGTDLGVMSLDQLVHLFNQEIASRTSV